MKNSIALAIIVAAIFSSCKKADNTQAAPLNSGDAIKPSAEFKINNLVDGQYITEGKNLKLENLSKNAVSYSWDFGNGVLKTIKTPGNAYYLPCGGTYTISLTATNNAGDKSVFTKEVTVLCSGKNTHNQYLGY